MRTAVASRAATRPNTAWDTTKVYLKPLASLRVTVWLFALSAFLVLIGTLALDKQGMWEVVDGYFRTSLAPPNFGFAWVTAETFFPRKWFPGIELWQMKAIMGTLILGSAAVAGFFCWLLIRSDTLRIAYVAAIVGLGIVWGVLTFTVGGFFFPGGLLIGAALIVNLLAAHATRFTIQTRGMRLASGLIVIASGIAVGILIVLHGHNQDGLRGEPDFEWMTLWWYVKGGLTVGWIACVVPAVIHGRKYFQQEQRDSKTFTLMVLAGVGSVILGGVMVFLWIISPDYWIGEAAIRVLWQLLQGSIAAFVLMVGCILAFKKRAGIVLLHAGVGLLMFNELFVGYHAIEHQMLIEEGKTATFAYSDQDVELAVVIEDEQDPTQEKVVVVPIARNGQLSDLAEDGGVIEHDELPFDIEVLEFHTNSTLVKPDEDKSYPTIKKLDREELVIKGLPPAAGADSGSNIASAYVRLTKKNSDKEIGTYLFSQVLTDLQRLTLKDPIPEVVNVNGEPYQISLRFKRVYKPYSIYLKDVLRENYIGSSQPKDFSSYIAFKDHERNTTLDHRIWMNNPMRYAGWTFYQSSHDESYGNEYTVLQVVKNRGWMIPYLACMVVVVGMAVHFVLTLGRFLNRLSSPVRQPADQTKGGSQKGSKGPAGGGQPSLVNSPNREFSAWVLWGVPIAVVVLMAGYVGRKSVPPKPVEHEMQLYEFGKLPVVFRGRAKPMDSLALDSMRIMRNRSTFEDTEGEKQPAIVWLLDTIAGKEEAEKHEVFRITNLELLEALGLERKKGYLYSLSAIKPKIDYLSKQSAEAHRVQREGGVLTGFQEHVIDLESKLRRYHVLQEGFLLPPEDLTTERFLQLGHLARVVKGVDDSLVPLPVPRQPGPQHADEKAWQPLVSAYMDVWIYDTAKELGAKNVGELAKKLGQEFVETKDGYFQKNFDEIATGYMQQRFRIPQNEIAAVLKSLPENERNNLYLKVGEEKALDYADNILNSLKEAGYDSKSIREPNPAARALANILIAYRKGRVDEFNEGVAAYKQLLNEELTIYEEDASKVNLEAFFNHSAWLFNSWVLYIVAFVLIAVSWLVAPLGWYRPVNRAALALVIFVFLLHTVALILRIIISGRPPVTNLYSSAVFIGWGGVLIGLIVEAVFRIGFGHVLSAVVGILTIAIAWFGLSSKGDTLGVMQAVLDTQFWLATHVVCITLGYSTMFLAGLVGTVYVVLGLFTPLLPRICFRDWSFGTVLTKLIYGIACFALFFSFFGTVLGGLWGDESWGRFWGWDPKENGALIIVLWSALILHARWGKIVKERGLAVLAIGGNIVTAWSWFGVNQLGIGLHSYGFTEGVLKLLGFYVLSQLIIIVAGMLPLSLWRSFEDQNGDIIDAQPT